MKEYLLLFRNASDEHDYIATSKNRSEDMPLWQTWIDHIAMPGKLITTDPIEYGASLVNTEGVKPGPHKEANTLLISGFLICKAESLDEVEMWSRNCPILKYPDSSVEIRPIIPFPQN